MVRKRENGRWEGRIVVGRKENGDLIFRYTYRNILHQSMARPALKWGCDLGLMALILRIVGIQSRPELSLPGVIGVALLHMIWIGAAFAGAAFLFDHDLLHRKFSTTAGLAARPNPKTSRTASAAGKNTARTMRSSSGTSRTSTFPSRFTPGRPMMPAAGPLWPTMPA